MQGDQRSGGFRSVSKPTQSRRSSVVEAESSKQGRRRASRPWSLSPRDTAGWRGAIHGQHGLHVWRSAPRPLRLHWSGVNIYHRTIRSATHHAGRTMHFDKSLYSQLRVREPMNDHGVAPTAVGEMALHQVGMAARTARTAHLTYTRAALSTVDCILPGKPRSVSSGNQAVAAGYEVCRRPRARSP